MVVKYLFDKFPNATSHELSLPRSKVICSASLAYIAVNRLELHKMLLVDSMELSLSIDVSVSILSGASGKEIIDSGWKFDPPKAISDVFESVIGAVLVDSGYDYEKTVAVLEHVMSDVLDPLTPSVARDPVSDLVCWMSREGCTSVSFQYVIFAHHILDRKIQVLFSGKSRKKLNFGSVMELQLWYMESWLSDPSYPQVLLWQDFWLRKELWSFSKIQNLRNA